MVIVDLVNCIEKNNGYYNISLYQKLSFLNSLLNSKYKTALFNENNKYIIQLICLHLEFILYG